jgi:hypothetical protein
MEERRGIDEGTQEITRRNKEGDGLIKEIILH